MLAMQNFNSTSLVASHNYTTMMADPERIVVGEHKAYRHNPTSAGLSMTLGILFNVMALIILIKAYNRYRQRSKATFLLFASSLVATDLAGHVIPGALVMSRYSSSSGSTSNLTSKFRGNPGNLEASCQFLGGSMVFFGLCPLLLGCAMAAERCLGITKPLLHAQLVTKARTKTTLSMIWFLALCVALLPTFHLGEYTNQYPGTWCFIRVIEDTKSTDLAFIILFSGVALSSLALAFVCNTISGITLIMTRLKKKSRSERFSTRSHDTEMVVQLVGIMVTSCICWSPLLVFGLISSIRSYTDAELFDKATYSKLMVTGVRMATWNQIMDPWVYILLRRAVLRKIYRITKKQASIKGRTFSSIRLDVSSLQNIDKNSVKSI